MQPTPLYRRVNTRARGVHHHTGGEYRHDCHSKRTLQSDANWQSMHGPVRRGPDYTPLFRFLLSRVGKPWRDVHSEAVARLDRAEPLRLLSLLPVTSCR